VEQLAFENLAHDTLESLSDAISDALGEEADVALQSDGVLVIEFESDGQKFVINSHRVAKQIWMAAYASAWHFDPHPEQGRWLTPSGDELFATVESVLTRKMQRPTKLSVTTPGEARR
jgi:CyaY protein